jgi:hypothetical protein
MAAGSTYTKIASTTLGSAASSVTLSSIPATYTDLVLVMNYIASGGTVYSQLRLNSDSGANYSRTELLGSGSLATSARASNEGFLYNAVAANNGNTAAVIFQFMNYSNTTTYKTVLTRLNSQDTYIEAEVNLWRSTAAINSIYIQTNSNNFGTGSTFNLYGIAAA